MHLAVPIIRTLRAGSVMLASTQRYQDSFARVARVEKSIIGVGRCCVNHVYKDYFEIILLSVTLEFLRQRATSVLLDFFHPFLQVVAPHATQASILMKAQPKHAKIALTENLWPGEGVTAYRTV